jgi:5-methylcytosine-specific restriction protein B
MKEFKVPKNVHIIGTMNTADRSLAQIDYALRRRFFFYRLSPIEGNDAPILRRWLKDNPEVPGPKAEEVLKLFVALNKKIAGDLGEDFHIGHSHFMSSRVATAEGLDRIWRRSVEPLLNEYFHNRKDRQELVDSYRFDRVTSEAFLGEEGEPTGNDG